jgi:hypothetical protein
MQGFNSLHFNLSEQAGILCTQAVFKYIGFFVEKQVISMGKDFLDKISEHKLSAMAVVLFICLILTGWVQVYLGIDAVYTHWFYIPIIMSGMWYHKKAIIFAFFLGMFHIIAGYVLEGTIIINTFIRTFMFLLVAYVF